MMQVAKEVPLASLTTLRVGGAARYVLSCESEEDVVAALAFATEHALPFFALGGGSNVLAADEGYEGVILRPCMTGMEFTEEGEGTLLTAGAGVEWDDVVRAAAARGLWGIENLAGIPGSAGAAPVQNIGAYGSELAETLRAVTAFDVARGEVITLSREECDLGYRDSRFKREPGLIILGITLALSTEGAPKLSYKDLAAYAERAPLTTPEEVGNAVRTIRSRKFPSLETHGTAGSFFKNPIVSPETYDALVARYPGMPGFPAAGGMKLSSAWILDHILSLRGFRKGNAWLYDNQPLVVVADPGANAKEVDVLAREVEERVRRATGIVLEREVRTMPEK